MSTEAIKALLYRLNNEIMNEGKLHVADEIFTQDHIHHNASGANEDVYGPEGVKQSAAEFRAFMPDIQITVEAMIAEGDMAAARWTILGTYQDEADATLAPGQKVTWSGVSFFRIRDGKICERWAYGDEPHPVV